MKLNHDCVRKILLHIEENITYGHHLTVAYIPNEDFSKEELLYAADKLIEAGYIDGKKITSVSSSLPAIRITALTWSGHQFLDNIRDEGIWQDTKNVVSKFSSVSLSMMGNVASQIIISLIQNCIGLH